MIKKVIRKGNKLNIEKDWMKFGVEDIEMQVFLRKVAKDDAAYFPFNSRERGYLILESGNIKVNDLELDELDSIEIHEEDLEIRAKEDSSMMLLLFEDKVQ